MMRMKLADKKRNRIPLLVVGAILIALVISASALYFGKPSPNPGVQPQKMTSKTGSGQRELLLPGAKTPIPLPIDSSLLTRPDGQLILVNKSMPVDLDYAPTDLVLPTVAYRTDKSQEEVMVRAALVEPLAKLFADAKAAGYDLLIGSAYRSSKLQEMYFNSYSHAHGQTEAEKFSAHPGTSEHQLGLAVDLTTTDRACYLVECFGETSAGKWLAANVHQYGFILRYPDGQAAITGYNYEPWHFRYVGSPIATAVFESGLTYEEAFPYLNGDKKP